jgi:uncharacterized protein YdaU (DUF1376 family)
MDKPDAWMPHYIGDYNMETIHLTAQQDGIYMRLRSFYWKNACKIPPVVDVLCRAARVSSSEEIADLNYILTNFFIIEESQICHPELDKRYQEAWKMYSKKSAAGKKAVTIREEKRRRRISDDVSIDDQTTAITRTKTEKENQIHHQPAADASCSDSVNEMMTDQEFRGLQQQYFNSVLNETLGDQVAKICRKVPKAYIEYVFEPSTQNGIRDFTHILKHLISKSNTPSKKGTNHICITSPPHS